MLPHLSNTIFFFFLFFFTLLQLSKSINLTLAHQHPSPDSVALHLLRTVNTSLSRRQLTSCHTGNPIDDCWKCDGDGLSDWSSNRQRLADCSIGFGRGTLGGKNGRIYFVTDSSDNNPSNPTPGTLRHAVIQEEPLWIVFSSSNMLIKLKAELIINSYKTIDGRGSNC